MSEDPLAPSDTGAPRPSFPAGARCAHHPERPAVATCTRCGNYLCAECDSSGGSGVCLACAARLGGASAFPFDRDNYTLDGLLNLSLSRWKQHWLALSVATLIMTVIAYLPSLAFELIAERVGLAEGRDPEAQWRGAALVIRVGSQLLLIGMQLAVSLVLSGYWLDLLEGKRADLVASLPRLRALPAQLLSVLIIYSGLALCAGCAGLAFWLSGGVDGLPESAWVVVSLIVLLVPALGYALTGVTFVTFVLAHDPNTSAIAALRVSWELAAGRRWEIGGVLTVSTIIAGAGVLACCVGALASFPLGMLLYGALFLALNNPARARAMPVSTAWPV